MCVRMCVHVCACVCVLLTMPAPRAGRHKTRKGTMCVQLQVESENMEGDFRKQGAWMVARRRRRLSQLKVLLHPEPAGLSVHFWPAPVGAQHPAQEKVLFRNVPALSSCPQPSMEPAEGLKGPV